MRSMPEVVCAIAPVTSTPTAAVPRTRFLRTIASSACPPSFMNPARDNSICGLTFRERAQARGFPAGTRNTETEQFDVERSRAGSASLAVVQHREAEVLPARRLLLDHAD